MSHFYSFGLLIQVVHLQVKNHLQIRNYLERKCLLHCALGFGFDLVGEDGEEGSGEDGDGGCGFIRW